MRYPRGFSIIELVIAISLASFVLVGVATIAAQMARSQVEGIRSGTMTGWSLISYQSMAKEIEDANVLAYPYNNGDSADSIILCKNWSRAKDVLPGAKLDTADVTNVIQYCVDPTPAVAPETGFKLRRYAYNGNCPCPGAPAGPCNAVPVACTSDAPGGLWTESSVVGYRLEKLPGGYPGAPNIFYRDNTIGGLRLRYAIGRQTPTTNSPVAKFTTFDYGLSMQKQYSNTVD
ncbi:MAG: prepilin-type N-terminal cleavage/methylation domain-containing protein [Elusimicrobia bacterium]|nr:prepilin-type N-terminal cleavage/methylation domain-containing protein [Elusimicrobiota bacterium]